MRCLQDQQGKLHWAARLQQQLWQEATPQRVRDCVTAPLAEEWVFRACMLPLLLHEVSILSCP